MNLDDIKDQIKRVRAYTSGCHQVPVESLTSALDSISSLCRFIEVAQKHDGGDRYLIRDTKASLSLVEKLSKAEPGEIVLLTAQEHEAATKIIKV